MTAFNPSTAYLDDWKFHDFVETVAWEPNNDNVPEANWRQPSLAAKIRPVDMTDRHVQEVAAGLGLSTDQQLYQFWPNTDADGEVKPRDFLRRADNALGEVVSTCLRSPFGYWLLACTKETRNAAVTT